MIIIILILGWYWYWLFPGMILIYFFSGMILILTFFGDDIDIDFFQMTSVDSDIDFFSFSISISLAPQARFVFYPQNRILGAKIIYWYLVFFLNWDDIDIDCFFGDDIDIDFFRGWYWYLFFQMILISTLY